MKTHVSNEFKISSIAMYGRGPKPVRLYGDWTIQELSVLYPVSIATGIDALLHEVPGWKREAITITFFDSTGTALPHDPRVYLEDTDLLIRS